MEDLRAEVDAKSQAEAKLKAELNAKSDELEAVQNEVLRLRGEMRQRRGKIIVFAVNWNS